MRRFKKRIAIFFAFILLFNDPKLVCAMPTGSGVVSAVGTLLCPDTAEHGLWGCATESIHISYVLNGGTNSGANPSVLTAQQLPVTLDVPVREGYNFAGWYTDFSYTDKVTEISEDMDGDVVLFAKWTKPIDNRYNVEMYSYQTGNVISASSKELKECSYTFLEDVSIPGMPSTREKDYLDNIISTDGQCPQGLCFTSDFMLVSSYAEEGGQEGSLLVFDRDTGDYLMTLGMKAGSHLGGIAYDGENVWICHSNSTTIERISYEYIYRLAKQAPGCFVDASMLWDEYEVKNSPSCITCYGDRLWIATHTTLFNSEMISYSYDAVNDTLTALGSYHIPNKVQGIAFDDNGAVYLSTSYGRNNSSYLKVYSSLLTLTNKPNSPTVKVEMPPCSEELAIDGDNIYILFESASRKYFEGTDGNGTSAFPLDKVLSVAVASVW